MRKFENFGGGGRDKNKKQKLKEDPRSAPKNPFNPLKSTAVNGNIY